MKKLNQTYNDKTMKYKVITVSLGGNKDMTS